MYSMCLQIQGEIKSQLVMARPPGTTSCNTMKELVMAMGEALGLKVRRGPGLGRSQPHACPMLDLAW